MASVLDELRARLRAEPLRRVPIGEAARVLGTTPRMLRYRERLGLLAPQRSAGSHREFGERDLVAAAYAADLERRHDVGPAELAFALRALAEPAVAAQVRSLGQLTRRLAAPRVEALDFDAQKARRLLTQAGAARPSGTAGAPAAGSPGGEGVPGSAGGPVGAGGAGTVGVPSAPKGATAPGESGTPGVPDPPGGAGRPRGSGESGWAGGSSARGGAGRPRGSGESGSARGSGARGGAGSAAGAGTAGAVGPRRRGIRPAADRPRPLPPGGQGRPPDLPLRPLPPPPPPPTRSG